MDEKEKQRPGENKQTKINRRYIESGKYRKKFDKITNNKKINRLLYKLAKEMLYHRDGTLYEDMYWIDAEKGEVIEKQLNSLEEGKILYTSKIRLSISKYQKIITMHSHPNSHPPSINDFNSAFYNNYFINLIICHNGKIYSYNSKEFIEIKYFEMIIEKHLRENYNIDEAQLQAILHMKSRFSIEFEEV